MELHVFDFDGTIFHSPSPSERLKNSVGNRVYGKLMRPLQSGGLGWFQSPTTLMPPAVPKEPSKKWYVLPVLQRLAELKEKKMRAKEAGFTDDVIVFVLTGRDEKYRMRIEELLSYSGARDIISEVFLKPHETYGTVKFKLETFYQLLSKHQPKHLFYYEDREEQGYKILGGIRLLLLAVYKDIAGSFNINCAFLEKDGETRNFIPDEPLLNQPCATAVRWWDETRRRAAPDPVSSIVPFTFTIFFVDSAAQVDDEVILPSNVEDDIVAQLQYEKEAYDSRNEHKEKGKCFFNRIYHRK